MNNAAIQQQQLGFTPLVSVCNPLGMTVPESMKVKIVNGEYVDFALLLEKTDPSQWNLEKQGVALTVNEGRNIFWKSNKPKKVITSINSWTNVFLVFCSVYLEAHPSRVQEMLKYANLIRTAASRFGGWGWRSYDQQFRMRQQAVPNRSWAIVDGELWAFYVAVPSARDPTNRPFQSKGGLSGGFRSQIGNRFNPRFKINQGQVQQ